MRWRGGERSGNIDDRRGLGPVGAVGGVSVIGVIAALVGVFFFDMNPQDAVNIATQGGGRVQQEQVAGKAGSPEDEAGAFVDVIETSTTRVWTELFAKMGEQYSPPEDVVLYDQATGTACGTGQSAMGPFYCPGDRRVYLDLTFWRELESQFGAKGEFARAYVIAHEIGHHVQNLRGSIGQSRASARGAESGAVRVELQADCYAGVWAAHAAALSNGQVALEPGDLEDGLGAAAAVGDDTIQRRTQGRVVPDAFTHGSAEQRMRWFRRGYETGNPNSCDTFSATRL
ncbi:MAG: neutral zinc metallopeptidase [Caulobacter sp.]|nr:neutral zinc metallopeptidase [Caulobacter sp.]